MVPFALVSIFARSSQPSSSASLAPEFNMLIKWLCKVGSRCWWRCWISWSELWAIVNTSWTKQNKLPQIFITWRDSLLDEFVPVAKLASYLFVTGQHSLINLDGWSYRVSISIELYPTLAHYLVVWFLVAATSSRCVDLSDDSREPEICATRKDSVSTKSQYPVDSVIHHLHSLFAFYTV